MSRFANVLNNEPTAKKTANRGQPTAQTNSDELITQPNFMQFKIL